MRHAIRTLGVPTRTGTGAFIVIPARCSTAAFNGQNKVTGAPGTVPVFSPRPAAMSDGELGGPWNQPSAVAPNYILPSIYVAHANRQMTMDGANADPGPYLVPVPAQSVARIPKNFAKRARLGGQTVTRNPRPFIKWPTYRSK